MGFSIQIDFFIKSDTVGVCLRDKKKICALVQDALSVRFGSGTLKEILKLNLQNYWLSNEPLDKKGP